MNKPTNATPMMRRADRRRVRTGPESV